MYFFDLQKGNGIGWENDLKIFDKNNKKQLENTYSKRAKKSITIINYKMSSLIQLAGFVALILLATNEVQSKTLIVNSKTFNPTKGLRGKLLLLSWINTFFRCAHHWYYLHHKYRQGHFVRL